MKPALKHPVDEDDWQAVAGEYAGQALEELLPDAKDALAAGKPLAEVAESLTEDVRERTETYLFHHVKDTGMMYRETTYRYCPTLPGYRRRYKELSITDVPDELLDVPELVPDLGERVMKALTAHAVESAENN